VREDGQKVLLALKNMGGETTEAWRAVLDDLINRGLHRPAFLIVTARRAGKGNRRGLGRRAGSEVYGP